MSNSVRAWVLLVVTLLLGITIGVLGGGALQDRRAARVNEMRRPGGFTEHVRQVIRPTSDSQWAQLKPIVEAAAEQNLSLRRAHDRAMRATLDSLKLRLEPLLDAEQRERLAAFVPGRPGPGRAGGFRRGDDRGPRPDGPPPPENDDRRGPPPP
jgi:hypothetical protein